MFRKNKREAEERKVETESSPSPRSNRIVPQDIVMSVDSVRNKG